MKAHRNHWRDKEGMKMSYVNPSYVTNILNRVSKLWEQGEKEKALKLLNHLKQKLKVVSQIDGKWLHMPTEK